MGLALVHGVAVIIRRTIAAAAIVMLLSVDSWAQQPRNCLYQVLDNGEERYAGMMYNAETCATVAMMLNEWAKVEPRSPFVFVCRQRMVRT
jgi:hypothetical protein